MSQLSEELTVPAENLLQPDALRRVCWTPPARSGPEEIAEFLRARQAREWQIELVAERLARAFAST